MNGSNYVDGAWVPAASGATFARRNPADLDEVVGEFPDSGEDDVAAAVAAVAEGYGAWAATAPEQRAAVLERAAATLYARREELARELVREEGKTLAEASNETSRTPANLRFYAAEAVRVHGQTLAAPDGTLVFTLRQPVGVVAAITPWNFPINIASRKLGPALAAGNGVVFKPSEVSPLLGQRLVEALVEAGLPSGALALVQGGARVGRALVTDERVAAVTFTGSYAVGKAIHEAVGPTRRLQLELGGKNAVIVLDDSDLDRAVDVIVRGAFGLSGQACTGTSRVIAVDAVHDELVRRVAGRVTALRVGAGLDPQTQVGPLATEAQVEKVLAYLAIAEEEGARLVVGGERLRGDGYDRGLFVRPAVLDGVEPTMRVAREEVFGPVLGFERAKDADHALELANDSEYGLSASLVTNDLARALDYARRIQTGLVKVNQPTTGMAMNAPFGGLKHSSTQTYKEQAGETMMHFYTSEKTVYVSA